MTPTQFREAIARLGLSQVGAASLFKVNDRTARRWASGEQDIPAAVALALRLMIRHKVSPASAQRLLTQPESLGTRSAVPETQSN